MKYVAVAVSFFLLVSQPVLALQIDENRLALAKQIVELTRATEAIENMMPEMVEQQLSARLAMGKVDSLSEAQQAALDAAVDEFSGEFIKAMQPLLTEMAIVYAEEFSAEEMRELIAFYETDLGQRLVDVNISLEADFAVKRQRWARSSIMPAAQKLSQKIKAALAVSE